jgi:hypothetical protein
MGDSRRRQRGSILSSLLIIVAFLSILVGALMTELTNSFLISRTHVARMEREATLTSAVEVGIHQLQIRSVPPNCARDAGSLPSLSLNGSPASVTLTCNGIVPDMTTALAPGSFVVDGMHDTTSGRNRYLVADAAGAASRLYAYSFGQTSPSWSLGLQGALTADPLPKPGSPAVLLAPVARANSGCAGHCVALYSDGGGAPVLRCIMPASTIVAGKPAIEAPANGNFPSYAFFAGSGSGGALYVYEASAAGGCVQKAAQNLGAGAVGAPLVFPGPSRQRAEVTTTTDDIFVLVSDGTSTNLQHWQYQEAVDSDSGVVTKTLTQVGTRSLTALVGGRAVGYAISSNVPTNGAILTLAIAGASGRMGIAKITVSSGPSYAVTTGAGIALATAISRPPYWCTCPGGQTLIGVGGASGRLYLLNPLLIIEWTYDGAADGFPDINSTPIADGNGDWYFGADDGYVYDVEVPAGPPPGQLFKAARFGPGGAIRSSPIVGTTIGCSPGPCLYFGSSTAGSYFARLGITRVVDLQACVSSDPCSTTSVPNPRLWARVEVGSPAIVGGRGVYVQGWSYYSP